MLNEYTEKEIFSFFQDPDVLDQLSQYELDIDHTGTKLMFRCYRCDEDFYLPDTIPGDFQDLNLASFIVEITDHEFKIHLHEHDSSEPVNT